MYSEPCQTSKIEHFAKKLFLQNAPSYMFDRVLNTSLKSIKWMQLEPSAIARNTLEGSNFGTFGKLQ